jgi:hypothetical protein
MKGQEQLRNVCGYDCHFWDDDIIRVGDGEIGVLS